MAKITISKSGDGFERDKKQFFYFADTVWAAIPRASLEEWAEYLACRKTQGFNAIQLVLLPVLHDMSCSRDNLYPFAISDTGVMDFNTINTAYFDKAVKMLEMACNLGFVPALAPLWCNYIRDSWAAVEAEPQNVMPLEMISSYMEYVIRRFGGYDPVYIISGDTLFETETVCKYYEKELEILNQLAPEALTTIHLKPDGELPERFVNSPFLDFYMYQSGHGWSEQYLSYASAEKYSALQFTKPILNGEPCYEGAGYGFDYGRFKPFDVRKSMWQSILAGAKAGFAYGAHGLWNWHREGDHRNSSGFAGVPYDWRTALDFKGAWDASFGKYIFESYGMFDLKPACKVLNDTREIRMACSSDFKRLVIYSPYNVDISIGLDLTGYEFSFIDLEIRNVGKPVIVAGEDFSIIRMNKSNNDMLYIGIRG